MAEKPIGPGTVLAGRFRLEDLLQESSGAKFWRASDLTLARNVAVHVLGADDPRAGALLSAARASATVADGHILRVLDAAQEQGVAFVVNEWGSGMSLDRMLTEGPLSPRRAAWVAKEVADALTTAHRSGVAHGRLVPENVMVSEAGAVKLIGFVVDGVLNGRAHGPGAGGPGFGDQRADVTNLAALLYAALVGRWPGTEHSVVPPAPREHGHPLRPRQVRAGIPRPLDAICDQVLNPDQPHRHVAPIGTAHEVAAALSDFIGDPGSASAGDYEHTMVLGPVQRLADEPTQGWTVLPPTRLPRQPEEPTTQAEVPVPDTASDRVSDTASDRASDKGPVADPEATQAGSPVFFDEDNAVGWTSPAQTHAHGDQRRTPPPPPPLPEPEPKPLFAPDPPGGRRRRGADDTAGTADQQPFGAGYPTAGGPATGSLPPVWGPDADQPPPDDTDGWDDAQKAGRGWFRLGAVIVSCLVLAFAVVIAFNIGRGGPGASSAPPRHTPSRQPSSTPGQILNIVGVRDFDPEGNPPEENPQMAPLAVDGDPSTAWQTMTYYGNPKLGGLKSGVGLIVDLGQQQRVSQVQLTLIGQPTSLALYSAGSSNTAPTSLSGLSKVATATNAGTHLTLRLKHPVTTQYLVVWLTSLPPAAGGYRGKIAEVQVRS